MKKFILLSLLVLTLVITMVSCGKSDENPGKTTPDTSTSKGSDKETKKELTVAVSIDPGSINPYDRLQNVGRQTWISVYESLFEYGAGDLAPVPVLVDTYEFSDDEKVLTLQLKKGILFHNGEEMKASDVVFTFGIMRNKAPYHMGSVDWDNIRAEGDYTVVIPFNTVPGSALYYLCNVYILSESYMTSISEDKWSSDCIGTGPYMWGDFTLGSDYELLRFEDYREKKALDKITIRVVPDPDVQKLELETGGIDIATGLNFTDIAQFKNDENDGIVAMPSNPIAIVELENIFPDPSHPMADVRIREAISYSLDLETINKVVFMGLGAPATAIYPSGILAHKEADNVREYSVEKAKALLTEAGYPNGITIDLYAQNTTFFQNLADVMLGMGSQAGITFNVIACDFATLEAYMTSGEKPGVYTYRQYANGDPYILSLKFASNVSNNSNYGYLENDTEHYLDAEEAYYEAMSLVNQTERNKAYNKLMQIAYDRVYFTPIIEYADHVLLAEDVKGFNMNGPIYNYHDCYFE